jgi:hypothetical protein
MTKKIVFHYHTGFCGSDGIDFVEYNDDTPAEQLDEDAWTGAVQHAESYGYYNLGDMDEEELKAMDEDSRDCYVDSIEGWWELYNPEEHDGLVPGRSSALELIYADS